MFLYSHYDYFKNGFQNTPRQLLNNRICKVIDELCQESYLKTLASLISQLGVVDSHSKELLFSELITFISYWRNELTEQKKKNICREHPPFYNSEWLRLTEQSECNSSMLKIMLLQPQIGIVNFIGNFIVKLEDIL